MDAVANWNYVRMSLSARQKLVEKISLGVRELYEGVWIKYTPTTTHLLGAILERIDRATGTAKIAIGVLMDITGIKSRETIVRHVFLLEKAGCIKVDRKRISLKLNAVNVFRLIGDTALAFFGQKWSPKGVVEPIHRTDIYRYDGRTEFNKINDDGTDILPLHKDLLDKVNSILDDGIGEKMIARHGVKMVGAWYEWVTDDARSWSKNPGGLLVTKLAMGKMPPVSKQGQGRKAKANVSDSRDDADLWDEHGNPKDRAPYPIEPIKPTVVYPDWTADEWMIQDAEIEIQSRLGLKKIGVRDEHSIWLIRQDGQRLVIGYDYRRINQRRLTNQVMFERLVRAILRKWDVEFEQHDSVEWFLSVQEKESAVA